MPGFLSSNTAMIVCKADGSAFDPEKLREHAFTPEIDADGIRSGWVGMGDMLDTSNFFLASVGQYAGFSLRVDSKKPSGAVIRLKLAEAIREEMSQNDGKVSGRRKKELKETITASVIAKTDFTPAITDCLWDLEKNRLFIAVSSHKAIEPVLARFHATFGIQPEVVLPEKEPEQIFATILKEGSYHVAGYSLATEGSASLTTTEQAEERSSVAVQNSLTAANNALADGLTIRKLQIIASLDGNTEMELAFTLDNSLVVTGLKFPKPEKDSDEDATLLVNADICGMVADIVEALA